MILQFTNPWGERFYFVRLGNLWPDHSGRRLIDATTAVRSEAREFESEEQARETIALAGSPAGWEVLP